ncbi:hypothetical protein EVAR_75423_1 [Eumeta japonica]|uniref:Uncharacterized protein n=1 Tax=Eumeta variegata TaxID=151549 RepID=A0A4C1TN24_EUMVA|nr:hypothetical protein EVAR_75423_1 [Eumeta japonica]
MSTKELRICDMRYSVGVRIPSFEILSRREIPSIDCTFHCTLSDFALATTRPTSRGKTFRHIPVCFMLQRRTPPHASELNTVERALCLCTYSEIVHRD